MGGLCFAWVEAGEFGGEGEGQAPLKLHLVIATETTARWSSGADFSVSLSAESARQAQRKQYRCLYITTALEYINKQIKTAINPQLSSLEL